MKYIKKYENIEDRYEGIYVEYVDIEYMFNYFKKNKVRFTILYGKDEDEEEEKYFLLIIEGNDHGDLPYDKGASNWLDFYVEDINGDQIFFNWFESDNLKDGDWKMISNKELELFIASKKYNL